MGRLRLIALAATLVLAAAGCGASDPVAAEEVSAAATKTAAAGSSRVEIRGEDKETNFVLEGVADYDGRRAMLTYNAQSKTGEEQAEEGEFRVVGTMFYIRSDLFGLTGDPATGVKPKPWLSTDFADEELTLEDLVFPFPFVDPSRLLATFEKVSGDIESLGEEDVRGEPTRRYRLTLDLGRLIETAPARDRAALRGELEERTEKTEPVEIWIDEDGRARRVRLVEDTGDVATIEFFDFGIEADVEAPPKDQVEDFGALFDQGG